MTGPDHYSEAERLVTSRGDPQAPRLSQWPSIEVIGVALVHALLAVAAATAPQNHGWGPPEVTR